MQKEIDGGKGAEKGNKRAVKTGEFETLFYDLLTAEEREIIEKYRINDKKDKLLDELKILTIRERRMLERIKKLQETNKEFNIENIRKRKLTKKIGNGQYDDEDETITEAENIITIIQRIEEALTRVQEAKRKCIESLHKIETDDRKLELEIIRLEREISKEDSNSTENVKDDSFIKALDDSVEVAWDDYEE